MKLFFNVAINKMVLKIFSFLCFWGNIVLVLYSYNKENNNLIRSKRLNLNIIL